MGGVGLIYTHVLMSYVYAYYIHLYAYIGQGVYLIEE
jgi:hypothetical protein